MLTCKDVALRASDLVDGEVGRWDSLRIRFHLAICAGCRNFVHQIKVTRDLTEDVTETTGSAPVGALTQDADIDAIFARVSPRDDTDNGSKTKQQSVE